MLDIIKPTKKKNETVYKSLYLKEDLEKELNKIAKEHNTSFNNVVISLLEFALKEVNSNKEENLVNN
jgi:hypothetical protein